jgi:hypothetical protein
MTRVGLFGLLIVGLSFVAYSGIYKWVDEDGRTHYSDAPPAGAGQEVEVAPAPSAEAVRESQQRLDRMQRQLDERRTERGQSPGLREWSDPPTRTEAVNLALECARSRRQLAVFQAQRPVYRFNARCERVFVSDADRAEMVALLQRQVANTCGGRLGPQDMADILRTHSEIASFNQRYMAMPGEPNRYPDFRELRSSPDLCRCAETFLGEMADPRHRTPPAEVDKARALIERLCGSR